MCLKFVVVDVLLSILKQLKANLFFVPFLFPLCLILFPPSFFTHIIDILLGVMFFKEFTSSLVHAHKSISVDECFSYNKHTANHYKLIFVLSKILFNFLILIFPCFWRSSPRKCFDVIYFFVTKPYRNMCKLSIWLFEFVLTDSIIPTDFLQLTSSVKIKVIFGFASNLVYLGKLSDIQWVFFFIIFTFIEKKRIYIYI